MIRIHYTYMGPAKPKWQQQTMKINDAPPVIEALSRVADELLVEHVKPEDVGKPAPVRPPPHSFRIK